METLQLHEISCSDHGRFSVCYLPNGARLLIGQLPFKNNERNVSSIVPGEYICLPVMSAKFGKSWLLCDVESRSGILIHRGLFCGDILKGWRSHTKGCLLTGLKLVVDKGQLSLSLSASAFDLLMRVMGHVKFKIIIP